MLDAVEPLPRVLLGDRLARREAAALEPSVREFMETKFGADFGDVRIHTGPEAAAWCGALHARAFTWGHDVVFGAGQYAPASPTGRRLLAHELVHVLQQRAAGPHAPSGLVAIGHPHDACEREADRLADEALGAGLRSAVTPDAAGVIRRAVTVLESAAKLAISEDAKAGVSTVIWDGTPFAVFHLTKNVRPILRRVELRTESEFRAASAINITGSVPVLAELQTDIRAHWQFHLIQLVYPVAKQACYAGRTSSDGSMVLNLDTPVGMKRGYQLDSAPGLLPYAETGAARMAQTAPGTWRVSVDLYDHPYTSWPLRLPNHAARDATNYLYAAAMQLHFVTALVLTDPITEEIKILASLTWGAIWQADFRYAANSRGIPEVTAEMIVSQVHSGESTTGDPGGRGVADLIKNPTGDERKTYKLASKRAYSEAILSQVDNDNVKAYSTWTPSVPPGFFR